MPNTDQEILNLITKIYAHPEGGAGGPLHIVLDDGNTRDKDIQFCLTPETMDGFPDDIQALAKECGEALLEFGDEDERGDLIDRHWETERKKRIQAKTAAGTRGPGMITMGRPALGAVTGALISRPASPIDYLAEHAHRWAYLARGGQECVICGAQRR